MPDSSISKTANVPLHHHLRKIFQLLHKEQNPPDQLRDIDRGGNIVVHALMSVVGRSFLLIDIEKGQSIFSDALVGRVLIFAVYC